MQIPFTDLTGPTKRVKAEYLEALDKFLDRGRFILTEEVKQFEDHWAARVGTPYCAGVSSGADALFLALQVFGIGPGDEVITQGNAYNASVTAILRTGAVPRFADVDSDTLTLDPKRLGALLNPKTKALLPVHLYGQPNNMEAIMQFAREHNLFVIEDCAQAHEASYAGKKAGAFGDAGCFSFYPTKNLGAFGDAGAVTLSNREKYEELLARRNLGQVEKNNHQFFGTNMRLDPIQAIALDLKLKYLPGETEARRAAAHYYDELIRKSGLPLRVIGKLTKAEHVYHLYPVEILEKDRDEVARQLQDQGIGTGLYYPSLVYEQPFYKGPVDPCPVAERFARNHLALPFFPDITKQQQDYVIEALKKILSA